MNMTTPDERPVDSFQEKLATLDNVQRATLNILEDFSAEKQRLEEVQRASLNILEDFDDEKGRLQEVQRATLNILEDFNAEKIHLGDSQRALLNILEDIDVERAKGAAVNQQLETANRELEAFSYSVSHDLRAPLRAIDAFSRILLEEYAPRLDSEAQRYLRVVSDNSRQMGQLVEDLLRFSRLGRQAVTKRPVEPRVLVREVLDGLARDREGRRVEVVLGDLPACEADPVLLKQVYANLLSNALKFTRKREAAVIEVGCQPSVGGPVYFVRDNGVGFDMRYADKLFGVFQRLHRPEEYEGTGVGLAIVQRVIHRHGGRVWAEAEPDRGATFYFTLQGGAGT